MFKLACYFVLNNSVPQINADLCTKLGIQRSVTSAYHPQTNGLDERTNQTLRIRLSKLVNDHQTDRADYLDGVAYSMRTQKQASTKYNPFYLMFGRHPRTVLEVSLFCSCVFFLTDMPTKYCLVYRLAVLIKEHSTI